jgi:hypothetical protein
MINLGSIAGLHADARRGGGDRGRAMSGKFGNLPGWAIPTFYLLGREMKYANLYPFLFTFRDNRIAGGGKHCDTMHVNTIWGDLI